jgi:hypothetical protein
VFVRHGIERGLKYAGGRVVASFRGGSAAGLLANTILSVFLAVQNERMSLCDAN